MGDSSVREVVMSKELYEAALSGDFEFIDNTEVDDESLVTKTCMSNNIMHIAIRYKKTYFVREALLRVPQLMWEPNVDGNTPLHIAAEMGNEDLVTEVCDKLIDPSPLRMQNSMGNTPLHVAIIHFKPSVARILVNRDPELASVVNVSSEAPLHLAIKCFPDKADDTDDWSNWKIRRCVSALEEKRNNWNEGNYVPKKEKMVILIVLLLEKASYVTCWRDKDGLTPLHRAASLNKSINLAVIEFMIECCPQCIEVYDSSRKTILHHLINRIANYADGKNFLSKTHIHGFINHQDNDGNTPGHLALIRSDLIFFDLLDDFDINWSLKNKDGLSVYIIYDRSDMKKVIDGKNASMMMTEETCRIFEVGDLFTLKEHVRDKIGFRFYKSHDSKGRNVIHKLLLLIKSHGIIIAHDFLAFMEYILLGFPELLGQTDNNGDTPIHVLAQLNSNKIMIHLAIKLRDNPYTIPTPAENIYPGPQPNDTKYFAPPYGNYTYIWESLENTPFFTNLMDLCLEYFKEGCVTQKNAKGNTALHEAILANNYPVFKKLVDFCKEATTLLVNNRNETVLHLLATHPMPSLQDKVLSDCITNNMKDNRSLLDDDGLTPIMKAIREGNITYAERLLSLRPTLAGLKDTNGKTFWHLLVNEQNIESFQWKNSSFTEAEVLHQLETKDNNGKTPLHLAVEGRRFNVAELFLDLHSDLKSQGAPDKKKNLLNLENNEGVTPAELIGELVYVPHQFEEFFGKTSTMIGIRSIWGIPSTQIKEYVNTMGVIAALLTTITFTAAFTVPGGLDQEKGTPLLIMDTAFKFFMVADIIAMCLSMMVLFCLLWIMATGNKSKSVMLLDFSIILLLASFYATLVTFMAGLYATTHPVKPWVAIVGLVLCSTLILLMHKYLVMKFLIPFGRVMLIYLDKAFKNARKMGKKFLRYIRKHSGRSPKPELPTSSVEIQNVTSDEIRAELPMSSIEIGSSSVVSTTDKTS